MQKQVDPDVCDFCGKPFSAPRCDDCENARWAFVPFELDAATVIGVLEGEIEGYLEFFALAGEKVA